MRGSMATSEPRNPASAFSAAFCTNGSSVVSMVSFAPSCGSFAPIVSAPASRLISGAKSSLIATTSFARIAAIVPPSRSKTYGAVPDARAATIALQRRVARRIHMRAIDRRERFLRLGHTIRRRERRGAVERHVRVLVRIARGGVVREEVVVAFAREKPPRNFVFRDDGQADVADAAEVRARRGGVAGGEVRGGEELVILRRPEMQPRPLLAAGDGRGVIAVQPRVARSRQRNPRQREQQRDQNHERDQQRQNEPPQPSARTLHFTRLHVVSGHFGTIVTRSPRLSCKSDAALPPATEISMQPVEPMMRNAPSPL